MSGGVTQLPGSGVNPYDLSWRFVSGTYDPDTRTTEMHYTGTVHWQKYPYREGTFTIPPGYTGPFDIHILDVTMSDPVIRLGPDGAALSVRATSRQLDTWELLDLGRVDVAGLDITDLAPVVTSTTTTWTDIPAFTIAGSDAVFSGQYPAGRAIDPISFSYTGPGGAPDTSENWTPPGTILLEQTGSTIVTTEGSYNSTFQVWWLDTVNQIAHYWVGPSNARQYRAIDLATLQVGEAWMPASAQRPTSERFVDTNTGRAFYVASEAPNELRWVRYDKTEHRYVHGVAPGTPPPASCWDSMGRRAINIRKVVPAGVSSTAYDEHYWELTVYSEQADGSWAPTAYRLPNAPLGLNRFAYQTNTACHSALDGSVIFPGRTLTSSLPEVTAPATVPAAMRLTFDSEGPHIAGIPGTEAANDSLELYEAIHPGPDGELTLTRTARGRYLKLRITAAGAVTVGQPVAFPEIGSTAFFADNVAVDPTDGMVWFAGEQSQRLVGIRDGQIVANQFFPEMNPRNRYLTVGPDHTVYAQTSDGTPASVGGNPVFGFGRFERVGVSPTVTTHPESQTIIGSGSVSFSAVATGDPNPSLQWQVKPPGATKFADVNGQTGATLLVAATAEDDGAQYRAVFSNVAGRIATNPATLTIESAPGVVVQPQSVTVAEGQDAEFLVLPSGNPDPEVTWQRLVSSAWQDITPGTPGYEAVGGFLTVLDVTPEQSGTQYRAKLTNSVGTVYSDVVTLTVGEGDGASQTITTTIGESGSLSLSVAGTQVSLPSPVLNGDALVSTGAINDVTVTDLRSADPGWNLSGQVSDFTSGSDSFSGNSLGWTPEVVSQGAEQDVTAGDPVAPGGSLGTGAGLASAPAGGGRGTAVVGAGLELSIPTTTPAGVYSATLTITVI